MDTELSTKYIKVKQIFDTARQQLADLRVTKRQTIEKIKKEQDLAKAEQVRSKIKNL